jgi:hypothetical protein
LSFTNAEEESDIGDILMKNFGANKKIILSMPMEIDAR